MLFINERLRGYLIALAMGMATALVIDCVDIDKLREKKEKVISLLSAWVLITSSVVAAYNGTLGDSKDVKGRPRPLPHSDSGGHEEDRDHL